MATTKKFAVILSGCGVYDGAEIHEATMTMLAIAKHNCQYEIFAPDIPQHHVVNHISGEEMKETRNVLIEAARIARGNIKPTHELEVEKYDAVVFPGGFGAAKNLCTFAFDGVDCSVHPDIEKIIKNAHQKGVIIGALCISPVLITKVLGNIEVTIGQDKGTADAIEKLGGKHIQTNNGEVAIDQANKIVTNPCYMLDASIVDIAHGAENLIKTILDF